MIMKKRWAVIYFMGIGITLMMILGTEKVSQVMSQERMIFRTHCVILDAGHGGIDGGAVSCTGKLESAINLEIALKLEPLFKLLGYDTRMIRREDISIHTGGDTIAQKKISDLKERVRVVNETPGGILLSIHQNTFQDSRYSGAQVFYAQTEGSRELADAVQQRLVYTLDPSNERKCKLSAGVYLMEHVERPGILVECGFLSNPQEAELLKPEEYQNKVAFTIFAAINEYLTKKK